MNDELRILFLEDEEEHFALMTLLLQREGIRFTPRHVMTGREFLEQLKTFEPDLILADYRLPDYDGLTALADAQRDCPGVPVIMVSGQMGEEIAIEALKSGATDYVLKTNFNRLAPAVRRAARERNEQVQLRWTHQALQESEERFRRLVELSPDAIFVHTDGRFVFANTVALRLLGASSPDQLLGTAVPDRIHPDHRERAGDQMQRGFEEGEVGPVTEMRLVRLDGTPVDVEAARAAVTYGGLPAVQVVVRDVSERKRAEAALLKAYEELEQRIKDRTADLVVANERLRQEIEEHKRTEQELRDSKTLISAVFASLFGRVAVLDRAGTILAVNDPWLRFALEHGASSQTACVGVNYLDVCRRADAAGAPVPAAVVAGIHAVLEGTREEFSLEYPCAPAEPERWFRMVVTPLRRLEGGAIVTHFDITPQRQAELQIQRLSQDLSHFGRVSMMGELAAALAHELRQPLTAVMANAEAGLDVLDAPGVMDVTELREILTDIIAEDHRAGEVIRRLRTLLRRGPSELQPLNLNELINEVIPLLRNYAVMHDVSITTDLAPTLPLARGDRIQLEQVLVNLMLNALDSMKTAPRDQRLLRVRTAPTKPHSVLVTVQDSGAGIPPEHLDCIFDSFFTTKPEGMGMGLSICRSIVQAHHGRIWAENNPGAGAAAHFSLPAIDRDKEGPAPPPAG